MWICLLKSPQFPQNHSKRRKNLTLPFHLSSLLINTTDLLEKLLDGDLNTTDLDVDITAHAEPDLSCHPKNLWDLPCKALRFVDNYTNRINLYPYTWQVVANLRSGNNLTLGLPNNYKSYHLQIANSIDITPVEVDYIWQWKLATESTLVEQNDLPYRLSLRRHRMKTLTQLWKLEFSVHRGSFAKLCVWKFLKDLPSLELVNVHVDELTTSQVDRLRLRRMKLW